MLVPRSQIHKAIGRVFRDPPLSLVDNIRAKANVETGEYISHKQIESELDAIMSYLVDEGFMPDDTEDI